MLLQLAGAVLAVVGAGYGVGRFRRWLDRQWFLLGAWRWLSGGEGYYRGRRAARRCGTAAGAVGLIWLWLAMPVMALAVTAAGAAGLGGLGGWRTWRFAAEWRTDRIWRRPLHLAARDIAQIEEWRSPRSWITVTLDKNKAVQEARLALPKGWQADPAEERKLITATAAKLGIEAPEASFRRAGPAPLLIMRHSESAPSFIEYGKGELGEMLAAAVDRAGPHEIISGLGKPERGGRPGIVKASLTLDSPHFGINMGSGAGKSELAAFWVMQELRRGAIAMVLDPKLISQAWLDKDEDGEFACLPNAAYLSTLPELHAGMVWLGRELRRRNEVAKRAVTASGRLRGDVGPRLLIIAEELNYATPQLKEYWSEIREKDQPKKSPALTALGAVSFAGRQVRMHLILVGQMLTAEVTGSRDSSVKANVGVMAMARYGPPGWNTAIGKDVPMPPPSDVLGRIQLVTAGKAREAQAPKADFPLYRKLAVSGTLTLCPAGMPGAVGVPDAPELVSGAGQGPLSYGTSPVLGQPPVAELVSLDQAVKRGISPRSKHALRKAAQREPGFPPRAGEDSLAYLYDARALAEYEAGRR